MKETTEQFLARGGKIKKIPFGESAIDMETGIPKHKTRRKGQYDLTYGEREYKLR